MAFFPLSAFFMAFFAILGYVLMKEGLPSKFLAILVFGVFEEGLTVARQVYIIESNGVVTQSNIFLPIAISPFLGTFWAFMSYIAVANVFHYIGRDLLGRKKSIAPAVIPPPLARS